MNLASTDSCLHSICNDDSTEKPGQRLMSNSSEVSMEDPNMKDAFKLVQQDMNQLSLTERDQAYEDLHGVRQVVEEDPERIACSLHQMEEEIIKIRRKSAYVLAEQMSKPFVHDDKLRLKFLRSCWFDPVLTAQKFVKFFESKLELFGVEKLTKEIKFLDLNEEEIQCLMSGKYQLLPYRDRSGRAVITFFACIQCPSENIDAMLRSCWYFMMSVVEDEETQRQGVVTIHYALIPDGGENRVNPKKRFEFGRRLSQLSGSLPIRNEGKHFCFNESKILTLASIITRNINSSTRTRMRFHKGSDSECKFALMTYGIPLHALPVTSNGKVKVDSHLKWLQRRNTMERMMMTGIVFNGIDLPSKDDILLERGKPIQNSAGNQRLREVIKDSFDQYQNSTKSEKSDLATMIVKRIKQSSRRFLKQDEMMGWVEVSDHTAMKKVTSAFRSEKVNILSYKSKKGTDQDRKRMRH